MKITRSQIRKIIQEAIRDLDDPRGNLDRTRDITVSRTGGPRPAGHPFNDYNPRDMPEKTNPRSIDRDKLVRYIAGELSNRAHDIGILDDINKRDPNALDYTLPEVLVSNLGPDPSQEQWSRLARAIAAGSFDIDLEDIVYEDDSDDSVTGTYHEQGYNDALARRDHRYDGASDVGTMTQYREYLRGYDEGLESL